MPRRRTAPELVGAKLAAPIIYGPFLRRPRVEEQIRDGARRPLLVVAADAGFGKTTAVASALRDLPGACWYNLDAGDGDPAVFARYVLAALERPRARPLGHGAIDWDQAVRTIVREWEQTSPPATLVLDDFHVVGQSPAMLEALSFLVERLPVHAHLILVTRTTPALPLARWRIRGAVAEVGADDLRFTPAELRAILVDLQGLPLSEPTLHLVAARTEGWAVGVMLALHALRDLGPGEAARAFARITGGTRNLYDYFANEAFERQPEPVRRFLQATSILSRFDASLADELLGSTNSRDLLREIERSGLFLVPLDEDRTWFRYHHLFQEFLQRKLGEEDRDRVRSVYARAARLWERRGEKAEAIACFLAAGEATSAARLVGIAGQDAVTRGAFGTLKRWLDGLPEEIVAANPATLYVRGWFRYIFGAPDAAAADLERARRKSVV